MKFWSKRGRITVYVIILVQKLVWWIFNKAKMNWILRNPQSIIYGSFKNIWVKVEYHNFESPQILLKTF